MKGNLDEKAEKLEEDKKGFIKQIGLVILVAILIRAFIFNITIVSGDSMSPTLENKDRLLVKKYEAVLKTEDYKRGDVVLFKSPLKDDKRTFIKRVIGLAGDKINILEGRLFVNDNYMEEDYIESGIVTESLLYGEEYIVPENSIFVLGDNRLPGASNDSRRFASIPIKSIKGKAVFRIFPFDKFGKEF
nr:signal peptidase I [Tissierella sp.]